MQKKENITDRLLHFSQLMYFTFSNFAANNLWESASACSFGFVFSFIPITLIILTLLTTVIRIIPEIENYIYSYATQFYSIVDIQAALSNITKIQKIHLFDVFLVLYTEALFFIDDKKPQTLEVDIRLKETMCTDDDIRFSRRDLFHGLLYLFRRDKT